MKKTVYIICAAFLVVTAAISWPTTKARPILGFHGSGKLHPLSEGSRTKECFQDPEKETTFVKYRFEECGYPGPLNTGVKVNSEETECSNLPKYEKAVNGSGNLEITENVTGKDIIITLGAGFAE